MMSMDPTFEFVVMVAAIQISVIVVILLVRRGGAK